MSHVDLERALLGAVLTNPELLAAAAEVVVPADFERPAHRNIWTAALRLDEDGKPFDPVSVKAELAELAQLEASGGGAYLGGLMDGVPVVGERAVVEWGRRIAEAARLRRLASGLADIARQAAVESITSAETEAAVERLLSGACPTTAVLDRGEVASATWEQLADEVRGVAAGIGTGLPDLDHRLRFGGWRPGQLAYIGARTSRGKSALLIGMAEAAAAAGKLVLFFPLEMSAADMGVRRLLAHSGTSLSYLHSWKRDDRERALAQLGQSRTILDRPLDFAAPSVRSLAQIRAACRLQKQRRGLDLVCVDYLGLVTWDKPGKLSLYERTTLVSQGLKTLAMELAVPLLCAVQLNREPAAHGRAGRPSLAHFRDSGAIEQDADACVLIHQDTTTDAIREGSAELIVAKQRNGWTGSVPVEWRSACARFECRTDEDASA